jgi:hypothetical protein
VSDKSASRVSGLAKAHSPEGEDYVLRELLDNIGDYGIFMLTPTGEIRSWNSGAFNITGYQAHEVIGRHFSVFYPADAIARGWPEHELRVAAEMGRFEDLGWRVRKDGGRYWADVVISPIRDEHGTLRGFSKVIRDLTERKLQEERLSQSEERFRHLVEGVTDYAIFMLDVNGIVASWNSGAQAIKGYRADEAIGSHFSRFYPKDAIDRKWPEYELEQAREHGRFEDEGWRVRKDGTRIWANVVITALRGPNGSLTGYSKVTRDLTERRAQEQSLKESEERFRLMVESVQEYAIFMLNPDGLVMSWNKGAQRIKGYTADEIIGQSFTRFYTREDIEAGRPWQTLQAARARGSVHDEALRVRKDGSYFLADVTLTALYDGSGAMYGFAKVTRDLTLEKRIETLETEGRRINEFLAMLAHELRNPLAPIRTAVKLMEMDSISEEKRAWCRNVIERQATHLTRLVDDLLDVSRITRGKVVMHKEPVELAAVINRSVEASLPLIETRKQNLKLHLPEQPVQLDGDLTRLVQVFSNLLNNAAKYTPEGGAIDVNASVEGSSAVIRVRDNGIGMPADLLHTAFDLFQQGDRGLDRSEGGLGIGLTLVESIVTMHGGTVEALSDGIGYGSEFVVRLPVLSLKEALAPVATGSGIPQPGASRPLRILVVDDNRDAAETMAMLVEAIGHQAHMAHEGCSAADEARRYKPDLVLLDIGLPGMNGFEVAQQFKGLDELRHIRLVAATGYGQEQDKQRAREAGFDDFLVKPISFEQLQGLIGKLAKDLRS